MSEIEELSKAIQETANLGAKGFEVANKAGGFFARVIDAPLGELSVMLTDKLRFTRWKRLLEMSDELQDILDERGIQNCRAVPPKLALPIFEEASLEEDASIQSLWNQLLANSMDPSFDGEIRYGFVDMIKNITCREALLLKEVYASLERDGHLDPIENVYKYSFDKEQLREVLQLTPTDYVLAANNLMRLHLIAPAIVTGGVSMGSEPITIYKGVDAITMTPMGVKFVEACIE